MAPQDVISAVEKWKMTVRPCVAGKTWTAQTWVSGVLYEARKHVNLTCAVRSLTFKLTGKEGAKCCGDKSDDDD